MRILAIAGSVRRDSHNARLLRHVAGRAPAGVEVELFDGLKSIPPYDEDDDDPEAPPGPVAELREAIADADGLLFATPEYNSSIPGVLKNAIDWASRPRATTPLQGKPAAVIGASTGSFGAVWAQAELRKVLGSTGARVVDLDLPVAKAHEAFDDDGVLASAEHGDRVAEVLDALAAEVERDREIALAA
jgi:chromate reductase